MYLTNALAGDINDKNIINVILRSNTCLRRDFGLCNESCKVDYATLIEHKVICCFNFKSYLIRHSELFLIRQRTFVDRTLNNEHILIRQFRFW